MPTKLLALVAFLIINSVYANDQLPFTIDPYIHLASDNISQGISATAGKPMLLGGLMVSHESGLYVAAEAYNVDSGLYPSEHGSAHMEQDTYVGYGGQSGENFSFDIAWGNYVFPRAAQYNGNEILTNFTAYGLSAGVNYTYSKEVAVYTHIRYEHDLPWDMTAAIAAGQTDYKDPLSSQTSRSRYEDWTLELSKTVATTTFSLTYTDSNFGNFACEESYGRASSCNQNLNFSVLQHF